MNISTSLFLDLENDNNEDEDGGDSDGDGDDGDEEESNRDDVGCGSVQLSSTGNKILDDSYGVVESSLATMV